MFRSSSNQHAKMKKQAALAAIDLIEESCVVGVGTGSTTNFFIDALIEIKHKITACVASSQASAQRLQSLSLPVVELNCVDEVHIYIDGADEVDPHFNLVKGGGGALTREKIIASAANQFVCILDESKQVPCLGTFPLPVEVIPMARSYVARELVKLGGRPVYRDQCITDNQNIILDVHDLKINQALKLEQTINQISGIVAHGIFSACRPDKVLVGTQTGVQHLQAD